MGFAEFKKAQKKQSEAVEQKFVDETETKAKSYKDERFWGFTKDSSGNAKAIVRFLPQQDADKAPYVKTFKHFFKNPDTGRWFVEDCPWTIKETCPVCLYAHETYDDYFNRPSNERPAKQTWYIANVLIVKDEMNPENEGKVFLYKFGKEIFKKLEEAIKGDPDDDIDPIKVFNIVEGHNFRFNVSEKSIPGYNRPVNDYDKCRFELQPSEICDGDEDAQEAVFNNIISLDEFVDPKIFKSADELKQQLSEFLGGEKSIMDELKQQQKEEAEEAKKETPKPNIKEEAAKTEDEDDDDDFFAGLDDDEDIPF